MLRQSQGTTRAWRRINFSDLISTDRAPPRVDPIRRKSLGLRAPQQHVLYVDVCTHTTARNQLAVRADDKQAYTAKQKMTGAKTRYVPICNRP